jgi:CubicO group peptidase (beta-lactamase class C family)
MKNSTIVILALSLLISRESVSAQKYSDSVRIVNEALKMIDFPEPIFEGPYVVVMDSKTIEDIGFEQPNSFETLGIHGQMIYIEPSRKLVIAVNSAWPEADSNERHFAVANFIKTITDEIY